jgi:hypothetical protein
VPELVLESEDDVRRFYDAIHLRKKRKEISGFLSKEIKQISFDKMINLVAKNRCIIKL